MSLKNYVALTGSVSRAVLRVRKCFRQALKWDHIRRAVSFITVFCFLVTQASLLSWAQSIERYNGIMSGSPSPSPAPSPSPMESPSEASDSSSGGDPAPSPSGDSESDDTSTSTGGSSSSSSSGQEAARRAAAEAARRAAEEAARRAAEEAARRAAEEAARRAAEEASEEIKEAAQKQLEEQIKKAIEADIKEFSEEAVEKAVNDAVRDSEEEFQEDLIMQTIENAVSESVYDFAQEKADEAVSDEMADEAMEQAAAESVKRNVVDWVKDWAEADESTRGEMLDEMGIGLDAVSDFMMNLTADTAKAVIDLINATENVISSAVDAAANILDRLGIGGEKEDIATQSIISDLITGEITPDTIEDSSSIQPTHSSVINTVNNLYGIELGIDTENNDMFGMLFDEEGRTTEIAIASLAGTDAGELTRHIEAVYGDNGDLEKEIHTTYGLAEDGSRQALFEEVQVFNEDRRLTERTVTSLSGDNKGKVVLVQKNEYDDNGNLVSEEITHYDVVDGGGEGNTGFGGDDIRFEFTDDGVNIYDSDDNLVGTGSGGDLFDADGNKIGEYEGGKFYIGGDYGDGDATNGFGGDYTYEDGNVYQDGEKVGTYEGGNIYDNDGNRIGDYSDGNFRLIGNYSEGVWGESHKEVREYNSQGNLTDITVTSLSGDNKGKVIREESYEYNDDGQITGSTWVTYDDVDGNWQEVDGAETAYSYNSDGNLKEKTVTGLYGERAGDLLLVERNEYDEDGRIISNTKEIYGPIDGMGEVYTGLGEESLRYVTTEDGVEIYNSQDELVGRAVGGDLFNADGHKIGKYEDGKVLVRGVYEDGVFVNGLGQVYTYEDGKVFVDGEEAGSYSDGNIYDLEGNRVGEYSDGGFRMLGNYAEVEEWGVVESYEESYEVNEQGWATKMTRTMLTGDDAGKVSIVEHYQHDAHGNLEKTVRDVYGALEDGSWGVVNSYEVIDGMIHGVQDIDNEYYNDDGNLVRETGQLEYKYNADGTVDKVIRYEGYTITTYTDEGKVVHTLTEDEVAEHVYENGAHIKTIVTGSSRTDHYDAKAAAKAKEIEEGVSGSWSIPYRYAPPVDAPHEDIIRSERNEGYTQVFEADGSGEFKLTSESYELQIFESFGRKRDVTVLKNMERSFEYDSEGNQVKRTENTEEIFWLGYRKNGQMKHFGFETGVSREYVADGSDWKRTKNETEDKYWAHRKARGKNQLSPRAKAQLAELEEDLLKGVFDTVTELCRFGVITVGMPRMW